MIFCMSVDVVRYCYPCLAQFTAKPVLSDKKQDILLACQTGGCLLLHESSTESSCGSFLRYFHSEIFTFSLHSP